MQRTPSIWHILALALALWGGEYLVRDLWEPDEARYAYVAREMQTTGNWAVPHRHGVYYAHKPPLMFWLINAGAHLTGGEIGRVATRLPSFFGAVLSLWAIAGLARRWFYTPAGGAPDASQPPDARVPVDVVWGTVLITMTTYLFWNKGGMGQIDALLTGLELCAIYHLVAYESDRRLWRPVLAYAAMGAAILAKGPVGFVVPFGVYLVSTLAARDGTRRRFWHYAWGPLLTLLLPAAWIAWVYWHHPPAGYLEELLFKQNVSRAAGELGHVKPFYYYLVHFPLDFMPWTPLWVFVPWAYRAYPAWRPAMRRLLAWVAFDVFFFSLSPSKRELYVLAAYPPAAALAALGWSAVSARVAARFACGWSALLAFVGTAFIAIAGVDNVRDVLPFDGTSLLVPGAVAALAAAFLDHRRRAGAPPRALLLTFSSVLLVLLASCGIWIYRGANALKAPYPVAIAANRYIAPDDPILLYQMNGEIMALYAQRPGKVFYEPRAVERYARAQSHALIVMDRRAWDSMTDNVRSHAVRQEFRMGHKNLLWAYIRFPNG